MFDNRMREEVERSLKPVGLRLRQAGISADQLTLVGLLFAVCTSVAIAVGELRMAFVLLALACIPDMLDGAVAKSTGTATARGAFFDSVVDRVAEGLVLGAIGWHLAGVASPRTVVLPLAALGLSMVVSYERARADSLGFTAKGGLMERAERLALIGLGLLFPSLLVALLWVLVVATAFTVVQRFVMVWRQATPRTAAAHGAYGRWRTARAVARGPREGRRARLRAHRVAAWRRPPISRQ